MLTQLNKPYWTEKLSTDRYVYGKAPCRSVEEFLPQMKKGRLLDIAGGEGRNAVYFAQKGFNVEMVDFCEPALEKARTLAKDTGVEIKADLKDLDFFLMPLMQYDSIVMTYYHCQQRFFGEIQRGLVDGGTMLIEAYLVDHLRQPGVPEPKPEIDECFRPNEVIQNLFKGFRIMFYSEVIETDGALVRCLAKKVAPR